jgi:hypothetical protein
VSFYARYTYLLHGEGHEVLYNHNVYVNEGSPEEVTAFQTFYENNIWKLTKQLRIFDLKLKNSSFDICILPMNLITPCFWVLLAFVGITPGFD